MDKTDSIKKGLSSEYLNREKLWDTYWLREKYPERFKKEQDE